MGCLCAVRSDVVWGGCWVAGVAGWVAVVVGTAGGHPALKTCISWVLCACTMN